MLGFGKWARRTYGVIIFAMTVIMLTTPLFANNGVLDGSLFDHFLPGGIIRNSNDTLHAGTTGSTSYTKAEYNPRRGTVQLTNVSEDGSAEVTGSRRAEWIDDRALSSDEREHLYEEAQMTQKRLNDLYESGITGQRALDRLEEGTIIGVLNVSVK